MNIVKDIKVSFKTTEVEIIRDLVQLGLQRLEEVDKPSWGKKYNQTKDFGELFLRDTRL